MVSYEDIDILFVNEYDSTSKSVVIDQLNKVYVVKIRGNPSTGFEWYITNYEDIMQEDVINPMNLNFDNTCKDFIYDKSKRGLVGVGGYYCFKITAKKKGTSIIKFEERRNSDMTNEFNLTISVL